MCIPNILIFLPKLQRLNKAEFINHVTTTPDHSSYLLWVQIELYVKFAAGYLLGYDE